MIRILLVLLALFCAAPASAQFADQRVFVQGGGTASVLTATVPNASTLSDLIGVKIAIKSSVTNNAAATIAVSGTTATAIKRPASGGLISLLAGDIVSGQTFEIMYDGTQYVMLSAPAPHPSTYQAFTSGTGTYTAPSGVKQAVITMVGPGGSSGGSGATGATSGGSGTNTSFAGTVANAGSPGTAGSSSGPGSGGTGGTGGTNGSNTVVTRIAGGNGETAPAGPTNNTAYNGGSGCSSPFGGAGLGSTPSGGTPGPGVAAKSNTGSGASGGGANQSSYSGGGGGGCGEYVVLIINNPTTASYTVGTAGTAGTGTQAGALGGSGYINVQETY